MHEWNNIKLCFRKQILDRDQSERIVRKSIQSASTTAATNVDKSLWKKNLSKIATREATEAKNTKRASWSGFAETAKDTQWAG